AEVTGQCGRGEDRREVADRVAPALVLLVRRHDDVGKFRPGRPLRDGDDGDGRPGDLGALEREIRRPRPALVAHANVERAATTELALERGLERLHRRRRARNAEPGWEADAGHRRAQDLGPGLGAMLARTAAGHEDGGAVYGRGPERAREPCR